MDRATSELTDGAPADYVTLLVEEGEGNSNASGRRSLVGLFRFRGGLRGRLGGELMHPFHGLVHRLLVQVVLQAPPGEVPVLRAADLHRNRAGINLDVQEDVVVGDGEIGADTDIRQPLLQVLQVLFRRVSRPASARRSMPPTCAGASAASSLDERFTIMVVYRRLRLFSLGSMAGRAGGDERGGCRALGGGRRRSVR